MFFCYAEADKQLMALQCCRERKKNTFSASYLQMFAKVIEHVNLLRVLLLYQLFTSTDWGYLTFIGRGAMY